MSATPSPALMGLEPAWGNQLNMSEWLDPQGHAESDAQSTGGLWTTTGTLGWGSTLTCQATTWLTSTSCPLRKSGVVILLLSKQEKVTGFRNMEFWAKAEWTGGAEKSTECNWKKQPFLGVFFKKLQCVFSIFTFSNWLFKPVQPWIFASLSFTWRGTVSIQPVCPKVLVKCKSSNIQHENVGEWFEFLRQIPFVNIAITVWSQL